MTLKEIAQDENTAADFLDAVMTSDNDESNDVLDAQRAALAEARRRLIARRDQVNAWSRAGTTDMIRANWDGIAEGLQQARLLIGAMWDDLPIVKPNDKLTHGATP